jgi:hypothetical protein
MLPDVRPFSSVGTALNAVAVAWDLRTQGGGMEAIAILALLVALVIVIRRERA